MSHNATNVVGELLNEKGAFTVNGLTWPALRLLRILNRDAKVLVVKPGTDGAVAAPNLTMGKSGKLIPGPLLPDQAYRVGSKGYPALRRAFPSEWAAYMVETRGLPKGDYVDVPVMVVDHRLRFTDPDTGAELLVSDAPSVPGFCTYCDSGHVPCPLARATDQDGLMRVRPAFRPAFVRIGRRG